MLVKVRGNHIVIDHLRKFSVLYERRSIDFIKVQNEIHFCKPHLCLFSMKTLENSYICYIIFFMA